MRLNKTPIELTNIISPEITDFIVKSRRNYPEKKAYSLFIFSLIWNAFISIFVITFLAPILKGKEVHFKTNDVPTTGSLENWKPILVPGLFISLFVAVGIGMFIWSLVLYFQKGSYFAGTETRFIKYRNGEITVTDWEQFTGNIRISNKNNYGNLEFELRTGKMKNRDKGSNKFVPDIIYMAGIDNVFEIEKKCRIRIKENDPTPRINIKNKLRSI